MQTNKNVINEPKGVHRRRTITLLIVAVVILLAVGGFLLYKKHHDNKPISERTYKTIAEARTAFAQQELKDKDYKSYQIRVSTDANGDISLGHYEDAEKVLNEVVASVPKDKIISQTYRSYWYLYEQKGDTQNRKKYALLTAEKLKAEGQTKEAATFEEDAKGN